SSPAAPGRAERRTARAAGASAPARSARSRGRRRPGRAAGSRRVRLADSARPRRTESRSAASRIPLANLRISATICAILFTRTAMPSAPVEQSERRRAIARLLAQHAINRQAELVELLRIEGYPATQSSVSRDLRDLGATKA